MTRAQANGIGRAGEVNIDAGGLGYLNGLAQAVYLVESQRLELIDAHAHFLLHVGRHKAEIRHQGIQLALLAQVFDAQCLDLVCILSLQGTNLFYKFLDFLYHSRCVKIFAKVQNNSQFIIHYS